MRYVQRKNGDGWEVKSGTVTRIACCDCGLIHDLAVVARGKTIGLAAQRNNRATAQRRRRLKESA